MKNWNVAAVIGWYEHCSCLVSTNAPLTCAYSHWLGCVEVQKCTYVVDTCFSENIPSIHLTPLYCSTSLVAFRKCCAFFVDSKTTMDFCLEGLRQWNLILMCSSLQYIADSVTLWTKCHDRCVYKYLFLFVYFVKHSSSWFSSSILQCSQVSLYFTCLPDFKPLGCNYLLVL